MRRTSSNATSTGRRPTTRRSIERDTNRTPATGAGTRPGTATTATDGTCVVNPNRCAAATSAGPAPGPATSKAMSAGRGAAIPNLVFGPFQYKPFRTRRTSPSAANRDNSHSTARRDPGNSAAAMKPRAGAAAIFSRTFSAALMRGNCIYYLSNSQPRRRTPARPITPQKRSSRSMEAGPKPAQEGAERAQGRGEGAQSRPSTVMKGHQRLVENMP